MTAGTRVVVQAAELPAHGKWGTVIGHYELSVPLMLVKLDDGDFLLTPLSDLAGTDRFVEPDLAA